MWHSIIEICASIVVALSTGPGADQGQIMANDITDRELIVLAAPQADDPYYAKFADEIFDFHIAYARQIMENDDVLILTDQKSRAGYVAALGERAVLTAAMEDIWMRDFTLSNVEAPVMFRYTAEGQGGGRRGQREADVVQDVFATYIDEIGLTYRPSDLLNDGGNFVDNYAGMAVISRKFLRDNRMSEEQARTALRAETGIEHFAFIEADEQGGLEHSDGVVAFVSPNVLVINSYPEDPAYADKLRTDLEAGLPGVMIHEIMTPYDGGRIYDPKFGSACGLYTNMLVTPKRIYFPQFGIPEDKEALKFVRSLTSKQVIPVRSDQVCHMGGGVRCMSWQVRGKNAKLLLGSSESLR